MIRKFESLERINSISETNGSFEWTEGTRVNGWFSAVYTISFSQNFRLFHVSNLSVLNFRIFLLMYPAYAGATGRGSLHHCTPLPGERSRDRRGRPTAAAGYSTGTRRRGGERVS